MDPKPDSVNRIPAKLSENDSDDETATKMIYTIKISVHRQIIVESFPYFNGTGFAHVCIRKSTEYSEARGRGKLATKGQFFMAYQNLTGRGC